MGQETEHVKLSGVVTPTLMLGAPGSAAHLSRSLHVTDASEAFTAIRSGHIAVLPEGAWDAAEATLRLLGASEKIIADRMQVAKTGRILYAV